MRHAKSSWDYVDLKDHDRPLNERGQKSADKVAQVLNAQGYAPDIIWCSDAQRTKETAVRIIRVIPGPQKIFHQPGFYMASADNALQFCASAEEPDGNLMLLGHNPGWRICSSILAAITTASRRALAESSPVKTKRLNGCPRPLGNLKHCFCHVN